MFMVNEESDSGDEFEANDPVHVDAAEAEFGVGIGIGEEEAGVAAEVLDVGEGNGAREGNGALVDVNAGTHHFPGVIDYAFADPGGDLELNFLDSYH